MHYYVISNDDDRREHWETTLRERGFDVVEEYDSDAVIVTLGGDGTILYAARTLPDPTILPVRTGRSKGYKTCLESTQLVATLEELEAGDAGVSEVCTEHRKIGAYRDGTQLGGKFDAVNEISLHHSSPTLAAVLSVRIRDGDERYQYERVIGDGVLVATPFGSTAYYHSITGGTFSEGLGVAFNNVHTPVETPSHMVVSDNAVVEVETPESEHAASGVLTRDNAEEVYELAVGEPVEIRHSGDTVEILDPVAQEE